MCFSYSPRSNVVSVLETHRFPAAISAGAPKEIPDRYMEYSELYGDVNYFALV